MLPGEVYFEVMILYGNLQQTAILHRSPTQIGAAGIRPSTRLDIVQSFGASRITQAPRLPAAVPASKFESLREGMDTSTHV